MNTKLQTPRGGFTDVASNRNSLRPQPARPPAADCLHPDVTNAGGDNAFAVERGHPVYPVDLPGACVSLSVGELSPGAATSMHRHAYESLIYVTCGGGHTIIEGQRYEWRAGDAVYVPPWCWHQHVAADDGPAQYLTATNMPLLRSIGQTVLREED